MDAPLHVAVRPNVDSTRAALRLVAALGGQGGNDMFLGEVVPILLEALTAPESREETLSALATLLWSLTSAADVAISCAEVFGGIARLDLMERIESGVEAAAGLRDAP